MPRINEEHLKKYNFQSEDNNHIDKEEYPIISIHDISVQMNYLDDFTLHYNEKSIIEEGVFRGYILRFIYDGALHLCHPQDFFHVIVNVEEYNKHVRQLLACNKGFKNIIQLKKDILRQSQNMHNKSYMKDQELGLVEDLMSEITDNIKEISDPVRRYNKLHDIKPIL